MTILTNCFAAAESAAIFVLKKVLIKYTISFAAV